MESLKKQKLQKHKRLLINIERFIFVYRRDILNKNTHKRRISCMFRSVQISVGESKVLTHTHTYIHSYALTHTLTYMYL